MTRLVLRESNLTTKIKVLTFILQFGLVAFPFHSPKMIIISDALFSLCNQYHQTYRNKILLNPYKYFDTFLNSNATESAIGKYLGK